LSKTNEVPEAVVIPAKLYRKLEDHAEQKGVTVDKEAEQLLNIGIQAIEFQYAIKMFTKGADMEL
jgi:hypothetical protein